MNAKLRNFIDEKRVRDAIIRAEEETSSPISVSIAPHVEGDLQAAALRDLHRRGRSRNAGRHAVHFFVQAAALRDLHRRGRSRNAGRHAVHFFVVPSRRQFAVVGDAVAHERLGHETWNSVAATVEKFFRLGDPTAGLIAGIEEVGRHLSQHFPRER